jgi:periplasmic protein CpxP/Spy
MKMNKVLLATLVSAVFAAPAVMAQTADVAPEFDVLAQAAPQAGPAGAGAQRPMHERRAFVKPSERVEARLAYVRTALKITPAQQTQWEGFANVLRKHARDMDQRFEQFRAQREQGAGRPGPRQVSAIERLERRQQRMAQRSARLSEVLAAAKPLYASLSPEQKVVADDMLSRQGHRGHRRHHRGMHGGPV